MELAGPSQQRQDPGVAAVRDLLHRHRMHVLGSRPPPTLLRRRTPPRTTGRLNPRPHCQLGANPFDLLAFLLDYDRVYRRASALDNLEWRRHVEERPLVVRRAVFGQPVQVDNLGESYTEITHQCAVQR